MPAPSSSISAVSEARPDSSGASFPAPLRIISAAETIGATSRRTVTTSRPFDSVKRSAVGGTTLGSGPTAGAAVIAAGASITRVTGSGSVCSASRFPASARANASRTDAQVASA